jgi:hypothetical protein
VTHKVNMLRGDGVGSQNAIKTKCSNDHEFNESNTYWRPNGHRDCRQCIRNRATKYSGKLMSKTRIQADQKVEEAGA